ncbi:HAD family hydrolase [Actinomyces vulturis]|uniref:HAD family hydrolase n=1 Tax=Actinomyces vulturis TaxID=1857645 RepID=UPI001FE120F3|nr:HAD family phosphatase [Actinomyces vulturis]
MPDYCRLPAALLWDMDGTIVDSEGLWWQSFEHLCGVYGGRVSPSMATELRGASMEQTAELIARCGVGKEDIPAVLDQMIAYVGNGLATDPILISSAVSWIDQGKTYGVPQALVSASPLSLLEATSMTMGHPFHTLVGHGDTLRSKPSPDPYVEAMRRLGVPAGECLALEDSLTGVRAAAGSGAWVIAVGPGVESLRTEVIRPGGGCSFALTRYSRVIHCHTLMDLGSMSRAWQAIRHYVAAEVAVAS